MNINIKKDYEKLSVDINEYDADPKINIDILSTKPDKMGCSFDFISIHLYNKDYSESANIILAKDALDKFIVKMEEAIKSYKEKNLCSIES